MAKLLPCPFCGGTAVLEKMGWPHHVFCIKCGAKTTSGKYAEEGEQEAIEKWNRRVNQDECENMYRVITSGHCPYADGVDEDVKSCADCPWHNPEAEQRFFEEVTQDE